MQHLHELTRGVDHDVARAAGNRETGEARAARAHVRADAHRHERDGRRDAERRRQTPVRARAAAVAGRSGDSDAAAKTAIARDRRDEAIAVAQCSTTESGRLPRRTVSAPSDDLGDEEARRSARRSAR